MNIAIIGGGPAGLATAIELVNKGAAVDVLESGEYAEYRPGEHLPPDGVMALKELTKGINWNDKHNTCFGVESSWGSDELNYVDYINHPINYGLNLNRPRFDSELAEYAKSIGVKLYLNTRCVSARFENEKWSLVAHSPGKKHHLEADFVVDASGRRASFARMQHKYPVQFDRLVAISVLTRAKEDFIEDNQNLLVETTELGWWYFVALNVQERQYAMAVFLTDEDLLAKGKNRIHLTWKNAFRQSRHIRKRLQPYLYAQHIHGFPVASQTLPSPRGSAWMAVGDAAIAFDPLSSKGMGKAFATAERNAQTIVDYLEGNELALDIYRSHIRDELNQYLELRKNYYNSEKRWPQSVFWSRRQEIEETLVQAQRSFDKIKTKFKKHSPEVEKE